MPTAYKAYGLGRVLAAMAASCAAVMGPVVPGGVPWQLPQLLVETSMPISPLLEPIALVICVAVLPTFPVNPWQAPQYAS